MEINRLDGNKETDWEHGHQNIDRKTHPTWPAKPNPWYSNTTRLSIIHPIPLSHPNGVGGLYGVDVPNGLDGLDRGILARLVGHAGIHEWFPNH